MPQAHQHTTLINTMNIDEAVEEYQWLVGLILKKYYVRYDLEEDARQEGNIGLMKAAEMFDETKGFKFSTYATHWIK